MTRYPRLNRQPTNRVSIPSLDGGINTKDSATLINDNQLCDAENMWFDGKSLKTRPKISKTNEFKTSEIYSKGLVKSFDINYNNSDLKVDIELITETKLGLPKLDVKVYDLKSGQIYSSELVDLNEGYVCDYPFWVNAYCGTAKEHDDLGVYIIVDYSLHAVNLYGYYPKRIYKVGFKNSIVSLTELFHFNEENRVVTDKLYKPLMYINGKGDMYSYLPTAVQTKYASASMFEGKNMLPSGMRFQFMTDGISTSFQLPVKNLENYCKVKIDLSGTGLTVYKGTDSLNLVQFDSNIIEVELENGFNETNFWIYGIVPIYKSNEGKNLTADKEYQNDKTYYTRNDDTGAFTVISNVTVGDKIEGNVYEYTGDINYSLFKTSYLMKKPVCINFNADNGAISIFDGTLKSQDIPLVMPIGSLNNIEITAYKHNFEQFDTLMQMNLCSLYGGGEGIFGGVRTFLAGYKNKMCWSDFEEPTYFSENNCIDVGDSAPITAFGKMNDILVIFKKNSIYYTKTYSGKNVTAKQIQNGEVVDVSATYAYFPVFRLSDEYGCDLPGTVKLCLNRLVFASSDGNVYCIVTQSNTSQRNIYCLSGQIRRKMFNYDNACLLNKNAFAANWQDYYLLFCDDNVWVMNCNKDSYRYVYSYTNKTNNSTSRHFTWWFWRLNNSVRDCMVINQKLYLLNYRKQNAVISENDDGTVNASSDKFIFYTDIFEINAEESEDNCVCFIKTKVFDFSSADRYKKIEKLFISLGNDTPADILLTIETDKGEVYSRPIEVDCNESRSRFTADYNTTVRLIPYCNKIRQFSLKLESTGVMSIEKIYIYYKRLSEVIENG